LDELKLENHNPIKNAMWIKKSDLELDTNELYERKLRKEISNRPSFMSDTKWFKFFTETKKIGIKKIYVKFLLDREYELHSWEDGFYEKGFEDGANPPFLYRNIEWLRIPKTYEIERWNGNEKLASQLFVQPIEKLRELLDNLGKYEYDIGETEIVIYGYK
jgi:hypothetical protein